MQAVQTLYILTSDQLFSNLPCNQSEQTLAEPAAAGQGIAEIRRPAVPDRSPDTDRGTADSDSSQIRPSREFEDIADAWAADSRNWDIFEAWERDVLLPVAATAAPVTHPAKSPKVDTLRAPLSPTAANRTRWTSAAGCPGAAKAPPVSAAAKATTAPVDILRAASETGAAAVAEHTPGLPTARGSGGSHLSRGGESGGRPGQKRGHAVAERSVTEGNAAGDKRKRCALSKNQAQVLARRGAARASPCLAAWTQNADDTDDFMM